MVADVVDDLEFRLAFRSPQAAAELLQPNDAGLGRPQHQDGVDVGNVESLVEHVDGKQDVESPVGKRLERRSPRGRSFSRVNRHGTHTVVR